MPLRVVAKVALGVQQHFLIRFPEWFSSVVLFNFGWTLLQSPDELMQQPSFVVMQRMADQDVWGWIITLTASVRILALTLNGTFPRFEVWTPHARAVMAALSCAGWFMIALGIFLSNPTAPAWRTYAAFLIGDMIMAIVIAGEAATAECRRRRGYGYRE
jgi:hypothetical protein